MADHDVPDSTDWLSTPLSGFAAVESALRCEVCKDFYKTPMITSCSHTFCSLCIRRALSSDGKCPLCRTSDQQLKLRSNWAMEETVEAFTKARSEALELARSRGEERSASKRKAESDTAQANDTPGSKRLRTSARIRKNQTEAPSVEPIEVEEEEIEEVLDEDEYVPDDGLVPCPVCNTRMKEWQVFSHLESCTGSTPPKPKAPAATSFSQRQAHQAKASERLPGLNYSMLKDNALRKKLAELGISNQGPRVLLERRHKEWITIWNANCDSARPRKRNELVHDLDVWERTQGGRVPPMGKLAQNEPMVKDKEFDGAAWGAKHNSSFQDLIANARKSRMDAKKKTDEASKESEEATSRTAGTASETNDIEILTLPTTADTSEPLTFREASTHIQPNSLSTPTAIPQAPDILPVVSAHDLSQSDALSTEMMEQLMAREYGEIRAAAPFIFQPPSEPLSSAPNVGVPYQEWKTQDSQDWRDYPSSSTHPSSQNQVNPTWNNTNHDYVSPYQVSGEIPPQSSVSEPSHQPPHGGRLQ